MNRCTAPVGVCKEAYWHFFNRPISVGCALPPTPNTMHLTHSDITPAGRTLNRTIHQHTVNNANMRFFL